MRLHYPIDALPNCEDYCIALKELRAEARILRMKEILRDDHSYSADEMRVMYSSGGLF